MFAVVVTVPLLIALLYFVGQTRYGKAMRATAQDPDAARMMGINVDRTISLTFLLGGLLAGAAGMIYALYNGAIEFKQGFTAGLIAFTAAVMGGIGNLKGAVAGGLIIGVIQALGDTHAGGRWTPVDRVRDPDPGHGLPTPRTVRRGDARGMSAMASSIGGGARAVRGMLPNWAWALIILAAAIYYPYFVKDVLTNNELLDASINSLAFIIMALGLNIVVGFAGLLDLGYVAFFAIGAFVVGWLGSGFWIDVNGGDGIHFLAQSTSALSGQPLPGIHLDFWVIFWPAQRSRASGERSSVRRRYACEATTSRS